MIDIQDYINSGIIEKYVLGLSTTEESAELENLRTDYPQLEQAVTNFEQELETEIFSNQVPPPQTLKASLEKKIFGESSANVTTGNFANKNSDQQDIIPVRNINMWRYIAAACIILLLISTGLNLYFYSGFKNSETRYEALLYERNTLQANNAIYKTTLDSIHQNINFLRSHNQDYKNEVAQLEESFNIMHNPDVKEIKLKGILDKSNFATVYWNAETKQVYFFKNHMKETPSGKQYQLWAIVHGKPVNAGVINVCTGLCKMKIINGADAFAVTLEKEGGSSFPTLTQMYVMGKV